VVPNITIAPQAGLSTRCNRGMMEPQVTAARRMSEALTHQYLPLFPLGTVLFPGGYLPLQIFEGRYLDMIGKCFKTGTPFGVVTLLKGHEVRLAQQLFYAVGTLAHITSLSRPQPGLILIQCTGLQRIEVTQHDLLPHGLWVANVTVLPEDQRVSIPDDLLPVANTLARVIATLQAQNTTEEQMPMQPPYLLDDCAWVANRWCELLPMTLEQKNRLMTLDNPLVRLELVSDLLERNGIST